MKILFFLIYIFKLCNGYNIAVVGANGNLGREIVFQATHERKLSVLGLTSNTNVFFEPSRSNSFSKSNEKTPKFESSLLTLHNYWSHIDHDYDHLVFCTSAKPFQHDYSNTLMTKVLQSLSEQCRSISLVSAFGVGDSLSQGNLGIQIMNSLYLQDVYRSKNEQESMINSINDTNLIKFIYRPKALSFGKTILKSLPRKDLAEAILNNIEEVGKKAFK